jgi:hypothetical protein
LIATAFAAVVDYVDVDLFVLVLAALGKWAHDCSMDARRHFTMLLNCNQCGSTGNVGISQEERSLKEGANETRLESIPEGFALMSGSNWQFQCTKCRAPA